MNNTNIQTGAITFENPFSVEGDIVLFRNVYQAKLNGRLAELEISKQIIYGLNLAFQKGFAEGALHC